MIKDFNNIDTKHLELIQQALLIAGFEQIKDTFLGILSQSPNFTTEQKLAIRLAASNLNFMGVSPAGVNQLLLDILFMKWQDVGLGGDDVAALSTSQREGILEGLMSVCRGIIAQESQRLETLSIEQTELPADWSYSYGYGYGYNGYGYGYENNSSTDFFDVFGVE